MPGGTGVVHPVLANNVNFIDAISWEPVALENAWYINKNVNKGKIYKVYAKKSLNNWVNQPNPLSLIKRLPMTKANIRKVTNHRQNNSLPPLPSMPSSRGPIYNTQRLAQIMRFMSDPRNPKAIIVILKDPTRRRTHHIIIQRIRRCSFVFYNMKTRGIVMIAPGVTKSDFVWMFHASVRRTTGLEAPIYKGWFAYENLNSLRNERLYWPPRA